MRHSLPDHKDWRGIIAVDANRFVRGYYAPKPTRRRSCNEFKRKVGLGEVGSCATMTM